LERRSFNPAESGKYQNAGDIAKGSFYSIVERAAKMGIVLL
jgi:hypothetical protein